MNPAIELLVKEKQKLEMKRDTDFALLTVEINNLETAIERLSGKKVWEVEKELAYDDEHPDYIKSSIEN